MAYRYTLVEFNKVEGAYELYCYENDVCLWVDKFDSTDEAHVYGDRFLNREDWFKLEQPA